jgi:hypothetical protein
MAKAGCDLLAAFHAVDRRDDATRAVARRLRWRCLALCGAVPMNLIKRDGMCSIRDRRPCQLPERRAGSRALMRTYPRQRGRCAALPPARRRLQSRSPVATPTSGLRIASDLRSTFWGSVNYARDCDHSCCDAGNFHGSLTAIASSCATIDRAIACGECAVILRPPDRGSSGPAQYARATRKRSGLYCGRDRHRLAPDRYGDRGDLRAVIPLRIPILSSREKRLLRRFAKGMTDDEAGREARSLLARASHGCRQSTCCLAPADAQIRSGQQFFATALRSLCEAHVRNCLLSRLAIRIGSFGKRGTVPGPRDGRLSAYLVFLFFDFPLLNFVSGSREMRRTELFEVTMQGWARSTQRSASDFSRRS